MCLIAFNWKNHPEYKLILVANRDEFFVRPSEMLHRWESGLYAGRDLKAGGTWLGMHPDGRFAALTNYRDLKNPKSNPKTRGNLVKDFLEGHQNPGEYMLRIEKERDLYDGFNLIVGNTDQLVYFSNYGEEVQEIPRGLYGISNALLNTPWEKVELAKSCLTDLIRKDQLHPEDLISAVHSRSMEVEYLLPDTGATPEQEKKLSSQFVNVDDYYGTVNTTVLLWKHTGEVEIFEKTFNQVEKKQFENKANFKVKSKKILVSKIKDLKKQLVLK